MPRTSKGGAAPCSRKVLSFLFKMQSNSHHDLKNQICRGLELAGEKLVSCLSQRIKSKGMVNDYQLAAALETLSFIFVMLGPSIEVFSFFFFPCATEEILCGFSDDGFEK